MATNTVGAGNTIRPYRFTRVQAFAEAQTQTFIAGDVLQFSTASGHEFEVQIGVADPHSVVGIAAEAASGVRGAKVQVYVADQRAEFRGVIDSGSTLATAAIGTAYGLVADATNKIWRVDTTETSNTRVVVTELVQPWTYGDVNGEVAFKFLYTYGNSGGTRVPYGD